MMNSIWAQSYQKCLYSILRLSLNIEEGIAQACAQLDYHLGYVRNADAKSVKLRMQFRSCPNINAGTGIYF